MTSLQDIAPSKIKPHPRNPRRHVGDVTELANSIKEQGLLEPVIVAPNPPGATFVLIAGHRRHKAAVEAGLRKMPCLVREDLTDPARQFETALVENLHREDLTPLEEAEAYQELLEFPGYTIARLAKSTGRSTSTVRGRLAISKLPDKARDAVHAGQLNLADALALTEFAKDQQVLDKLTAQVGTSNFAWMLEDARRRKNAAAQAVKTRKALEQDGVTILDDRPSYTEHVLFFKDDARGEHEGCDVAARIQPGNGLAEWICRTPDKHPAPEPAAPTTGTPVTAQKLAQHNAQVEARRAEREKLREDLATAAAVRRAHLADVIDRAYDGGDLARQALHRLVEYAAVSAYPQIGAEVLGLVYDKQLPLAAHADNVNRRLDNMTLPQLAVALDVLLHAPDEEQLESPDEWGGEHTYGDGTRGWRRRLGTTYAYEWSQVELDQLAQHEDAQIDEDDRQQAARVESEYEVLAEATTIADRIDDGGDD